MASVRVYENNAWEIVGGGHSHTQVSGSKSVSTGAWRDLTNGTTLQKGRWLILSFVEISSNSPSSIANKLIVGTSQRTTRTPGAGGGGVVNYYITDSDGTKVAKLQAYNYDSTDKTFNYLLDFIRLG